MSTVETPDHPHEVVDLGLHARIDPGLADRLTAHIATCRVCHMGTPPRSLCAAAQRLIIDSIEIEVADGSDSD